MLLGELAIIYQILSKKQQCKFHSCSFMAVSLSIVHLSLSFTVIELRGFYDREKDSNMFFRTRRLPIQGRQRKVGEIVSLLSPYCPGYCLVFHMMYQH